jgi:hypothetical protein
MVTFPHATGTMSPALTVGNSLLGAEVTCRAGTCRCLLAPWTGSCSATLGEVSAYPCPQAQWDCVNTKYKQKKRNYKNSGVVVLADLKVRCGPAPRTLSAGRGQLLSVLLDRPQGSHP